MPAFLERVCLRRAEMIVERVSPYLQGARRVVDIGCGPCYVADSLARKGWDVCPVDVRNISFVPTIAPFIYDGNRLPFGDGVFDAALLLMVLHHTRDPEALLSEALRVGRDVILIETIWRTQGERIRTVFMDTLLNVTLRFHWRSYKSDSEWKALFNSKGRVVTASQYHHDRTLGIPYYHATYCLKGERPKE